MKVRLLIIFWFDLQKIVKKCKNISTLVLAFIYHLSSNTAYLYDPDI